MERMKPIALKYPPVALIWSEQKPEDVVQFKEQKWGCIMWLAVSAARGKTAVCDRRTFGCVGGGVGMGFGNQYKGFLITVIWFLTPCPPRKFCYIQLAHFRSIEDTFQVNC